MAKPKRWENFKGKLPEWQNNDKPDYQEKVNVLKNDLAGIDTIEIAKKFSDLKAEKEEIEKQEYQVNLELEACNQILVERFNAQGGLRGLKLEDRSFGTKTEPYTKIEDSRAINQFLRDNDMDELRTVNWQTLNGLAKERLENGEPEIPGTKVYMRETVVMRKG